MTIRLMRFLDYWIGVPLCFLLDVYNRFLKSFPYRKRGNCRQKILFIKLAEMGGIVLASPLVKKTIIEYPEAQIYFLTFKKNKPLVELLQFTTEERILTIRDDSFLVFVFDTLKAIFYMRKNKINIAFDLELFSRFTAMLIFFSGAEKKIGFYHYCFEGLYRGNLLTHNLQYNPLLHVSKSYLSLLQSINSESKITPELETSIDEDELVIPRIISSEEQKKRAQRKLRRYGIKDNMRLFLVNPGEGNIPLREWPLENFVILSQKLLKDKNNSLLFLGMQAAAQKADIICRKLGEGRCINLTGQTTLPELLGIFNIADALITNDCGLAHLASLTPIKKFILFGPESPQIYSPLGENTRIIYSNLPCSPCLSAFNHRNSICKDNRCLKIIHPHEVYELIKSHL